MNELIDRCLWCALQVTLFTIVGAILYLMLRKQNPSRSSLPSRCLAIVAGLSVLTVLPWLSWNWQLTDKPLITPPSPTPHESQTLSISPQPNLNLPIISKPEHLADQRIQPVSSPPTAPTGNSLISFKLFGNWKLGFAILAALIIVVAFLRLLLATRELFTRLRTSKLITDASIQTELAQLQTAFQFKNKITLRQSPYDDMPSTIGRKKPVILLPRSWRSWSTSQLRAVLAHELAHIQNHDFAIWLAVQAPLLLHSYHPLVHWLASRVRWEQELSADREAVRILGDRNAYLKALAELALGQPNRRGPFAIFSLAPNSSMIVERLKMLRQKDFQAARPVSLFKRAIILSILCFAALAVSGLRGNISTAIADETTHNSSGLKANDLPTSTPKSDKTTITAAINLSPQSHEVFFGDLLEEPSRENTSPKNFDVFQQSQLALFKSKFVLRAALASKNIAQLETIVKKGDGVLSWLRASLDARFRGEIIFIRYEGNENPDDMVKILDAVVEAYMNEVLGHDKTRSMAASKVLKELKHNTEQELENKVGQHEKLAKALGGIEFKKFPQVLKIFTNRLDRIDANIERIEEEQLLLEIELKQSDIEPTSEQKVKAKFFAERIPQLEEKRSSLLKSLSTKSRTSTRLTLLESEIEQLRAVLATLDLRLLNTKAAKKRKRAQVLQPATIDSASKTAPQQIDKKEKAISSIKADKIGKQRDQTQKKLNELIDRNQKLATELGRSTDMSILRNEIIIIQSQINKAKDDLLTMKVNKTVALEKARSPHAMATAVERALAQDPMLAHFKDEKYSMAQEIRRLQAAGGTKKIKALEQKYQRIELEEKQYRKNAEADIRKKLKQVPNDGLSTLLEEYAMRKDHTTKKLKELRKHHGEIMEELLRMGEKSGAEALLQSEIE